MADRASSLPDLGTLPDGQGLPPVPVEQHTRTRTKQRRVTIRVMDTTYDVVKGKIPPELLEGLSRDFTPEEKEEIVARVGKTMAPSVPEKEMPIALFLLGPSAVGKSSITAAKASALFGSTYNAVVIDGAEFREVHAGLQAVAVDGLE